MNQKEKLLTIELLNYLSKKYYYKSYYSYGYDAYDAPQAQQRRGGNKASRTKDRK